MSAHTTISPAQVVSLGDRYVLAVMASQPLAAGLGSAAAVARMEALTPAFAAELGGRSARLTLDVQCSTHRARLRRLEVYARPDLKGSGDVLSRLGEWMDGAAGSYLGDAVAATCDPAFVRPFAALRGAGVSPSSSASSERTALGATQKAGPVIQLAAAVTRDCAETVRRDFVAGYPAAAQGHPVSISTARVRGVIFYRVLVAGFEDVAAAQAACAALRSGGDACFVRPAG